MYIASYLPNCVPLHRNKINILFYDFYYSGTFNVTRKSISKQKTVFVFKKKCTNTRQIWILRQNLTPKVRPISSEAVCTLISRGICHQNQFHGFLITIAFFFLKFYVMKVGFISLQIIWVLPMVSSFVSSKFGQYSMCITNFPQRF